MNFIPIAPGFCLEFDIYNEEANEWISNWDIDEEPLNIASAREISKNNIEFFVSIPLKKENKIIDIPKWISIGKITKKWLCDFDDNLKIKITNFTSNPSGWNTISYQEDLDSLNESISNINANIHRIINTKSVIDLNIGDLFRVKKEIHYEDISFERNKIGVITNIRYRGRDRLYCDIVCDGITKPAHLKDSDIKYISLDASMDKKEKEKIKKLLKSISLQNDSK